MESTPKPGPDDPERAFPIVGIGASAGGLNSLVRFLSALPDEFGFALVFMQHLPPAHKSLLPELLSSRKSALIDRRGIRRPRNPSRKALHLPPGTRGQDRNGYLPRDSHSHKHVHLPIDEFFISLAEYAAERAIAVIFSGAGTDGARGVHAVRTAGGTVFVQDPATAEFSAMPLAALGTGQVDAVLTPEEIAREILKFHSSGMVAPSPDGLVTHEHLEPFYRLIHEKTGYRFNHYKKSVISRRIKRRMYLHGLSSVTAYLEKVAADDGEARSLASDLMIGVTSFFRDRLAWEALHLEVTRKLVAEDETSAIRVWTPACATGEEAYSIAMLLRRELDRAGRKREIQVFATDVNDQALEKAREGTYPATIAADVQADYLSSLLHALRGRSFAHRRQGDTAACRIRQAGYPHRPPLLPSRPRDLPESPHLPRAGRPGEMHRPLSLRPEGRRISLSRGRRIPRQEQRPFHLARPQEVPHLPEDRDKGIHEDASGGTLRLRASPASDKAGIEPAQPPIGRRAQPGSPARGIRTRGGDDQSELRHPLQ